MLQVLATVLRSIRSRPTRRLGSLAVVLAWCGHAAVVGQGADFASLSQVESASETKTYTQQVRAKKFGADEQAFLTTTLVPQLSKEANRPAIGRTRIRIRELAVRDAAAEMFEPVNSTLRDAMVRLANDKDVELLVRVNAMLMVGELVGPDSKPWPAAAEVLAKTVADKAAPPAVRIAALSGLAAHLRAGEGSAGQAAALAKPVLADLIASRPAGDPVAADWMVSRAIELAPLVAPPPEVVAALGGLLADEQAATDLRVRAAAAVGRLASPDAGIDAGKAVSQIRSLAIAALETDLNAAEDRRFAKQLSSPAGTGPGVGGEPGFGFAPPPQGLELGGGGIFGGELGGGEGMPELADEDAVPTLACRRDAWRLFLLAEAIQPARSGPGLAGLLQGDAATAAADLATALRQAALDLDAQPDEATLKQALASLSAAAGPGKGGQPTNPEQPAGGQAPGGSPFDPPATGQPADSPF
jgi:hypothetical protein